MHAVKGRGNPVSIPTIEIASIIELSETLGQVAAGLFMFMFMYQIHPPTIDTLVTGMIPTGIKS